MTTAIKLTNISKLYRRGEIGYRTLREAITNFVLRRRTQSWLVWALKDINLELAKGEKLAVIGDNGSGKTTLLRIISGVTKPTTGEVEINGRVGALIELAAGFNPELTGRENIYLNAGLMGMSNREIDSKFADIVDFAELWDWIDTPLKRYSSGMYARLGFAVAIHVEPDILVVDEVLSVGDQAFQSKCLRRMEQMVAGACTLVFVTHSLGMAARLCNKGLLLDHGEVKAYGDIQDVLAIYNRHLLAATEKAIEKETQREKAVKKLAQIEDIFVLNQAGEKVLAVEKHEPFTLAVDYVVHEYLDNLMVAMNLETAERVVICRADNMDPDGYKPAEPGTYRWLVTFPGGLLRAGKYHFVAGLARSLADSVGIDARYGFFFDVFDSSGDHRYYAGVLGIPLEWRIVERK